jgi:hypothetical protein
MQLFTRTIRGITLTLEVQESDTIASLKARIEAAEGVPASLQQLIFSGKTLAQEAFSLSECGLSNGSTVLVTLSLFGGKGGFGSLLRVAAAKFGAAKITDKGAMRDMNGRRLRHVDAEAKIAAWEEKLRVEGKDKAMSDREVQEQYRLIRSGKDVMSIQECKWGKDCKYIYSGCKRKHPHLEEEKKARGKLQNLSSSFGESTTDIGVHVTTQTTHIIRITLQVHSKEEMLDAVQVSVCQCACIHVFMPV